MVLLIKLRQVGRNSKLQRHKDKEQSQVKLQDSDHFKNFSKNGVFRGWGCNNGPMMTTTFTHENKQTHRDNNGT